ncbi:DUF6538 domain-containing protein [Microbulbifer aggregans]|uniref:DUF6538 domain-containing protein n=1 Tax=Microbulbifer aggregans TaxID=1769779 RepID=UPI001CFCA455|nr:site-specific integrase [Microbulbifer aggregans]
MGRYIILSMRQKSNGYWYIRERVPVDVQGVIGKKYFERSLKTKDKDEAAARAIDAKAELAAQVAEARLKLAPKRKDDTELKHRDHYAFADMVIDYQDELIGNTRDISEYIEYLKGYAPDMAASKDAADRLLLDFLTARKIPLSPNSKAFKGISTALQSKWVAILKTLAYRGGNNWGQATDTSLTSEHLSEAGRSLLDNSVSISELYDEYKAEERATTPKNKQTTLTERFRAVDQVVRLFGDYMGGDVSVRRVTSQDASNFLSKLVMRPVTKKPDVKAQSLDKQIELAAKQDMPRVALKTVKKDMRLLQAVFTYAVDKHYIKENPFAGALKRIDRKVSAAPVKKTGYSDEDVKKAFSSDLFRTRYQPVRANDADYSSAFFWVPLICYYTGARLNEVAQLHLTDVRQEEGIWCIDINSASDDKRTKNGLSRVVPLHQHLIDLGFLEYIEEGKRQHSLKHTATSHRVFPELRPNADGSLAANLSKAIGRRLKASGIAPTLQPVHGFRHAFKTACRRLNVPEDVHDAITGHSGTSVGRTYGGIGVATANDVVQCIERVKLPVSHFTELK